MSKPKPTVDLGYPTPAHGRIPSFNNIEEEAEFWDTHDFTEFTGTEFQLVETSLAERMTFRIDHQDRAELDRRAREIGVGPSTLVRMWIKERLKQGAATGS
jgi:hypothetical protein